MFSGVYHCFYLLVFANVMSSLLMGEANLI